jgi:hypothetical protein
MNTAEFVVTVLSLIVAVIGVGFGIIQYRRAQQLEDVRALLGEKETVGFAAVQLGQRGLPSKEQQRRLVLDAIMQACLFASSDRARVLLYWVMKENLRSHDQEVKVAFRRIDDIWQLVKGYQIDPKQFDMASGDRRLDEIRTVIGLPEIQGTT